MKLLGALIAVGLVGATTDPVGRVEVVVREPATPVQIDPRLFGQFLERTRGGGNGAESAADSKGTFSPTLLGMIERMQIPVIRFPGGTTVDETDWTDLIDHVPGRDGPRPVTQFSGGQTTTNRFGYDEYFALRDQLHCQTILVLNVLDALSKKVPLEEAVTKATSLLAYANAKVGAPLPAGMSDWPSVRAANGHREPFHADYVQIGNEWFVPTFKGPIAKGTGLKEPAAIAAWYIECLKAYIAKIRLIDPQIPIIVDGLMGTGVSAKVLGDPFIRANIRYVTFHSYGPGGVDKLKQNDVDFPAEKMTTDDWWNMLVTVPGEFSNAGENIAIGSHLDVARALGYHIVCTEWNWNGFGFNRLSGVGINHALPSALGAAGFLNGLIREAGVIDMATQSNLVGGWNISAVMGNFSDPKAPLHYSPTARASMLYNLHHGERLLDCDVKGDSLFKVTVSGNWNSTPTAPRAYLDIVATESPGKLYLHIVNRHRDQSIPVHIDAAQIGLIPGEGTHFLLTGTTDPAADADPNGMLVEKQTPVKVSGSSLDFTIPPRSANILELPLKPAP